MSVPIESTQLKFKVFFQDKTVDVKVKKGSESLLQWLFEEDLLISFHSLEN